ncbi:hypothetical protein O181_027419 [Austropuccinia psidii MF-1]|uniref:Uncharacterized protein n=1 Tax=Austropuccinia psidii MF-1 TaxID=1389203 RepID=A0A9Q3H2L0_9BASI|nr:hypothetical protein [Austropuccinia psidii MF-1]
MRQDHGKHDWSWWKSEMITKWANNSWGFKIENVFESVIFNSEKDIPLTSFFKQKDRLSALHPDMSDTMINMKILRKCGGEVEHAIKCRCVEPCSTEDYINAMEDIITRTRIVIEEVQCTEEKEESDLDSAVPEETPVEDYFIENIKAFFEVTEVHTHLAQYSKDCHNLINIQDARMCKTKPARGKGYTAAASCITSVLRNDIEEKVNLDTGAFCNCVGKDYVQEIFLGWKNHLLPIEGVKFSRASNNMYPLVILDTNLVVSHPEGSIRVKTEIELMHNFTSQHIICGNNYLNIHGIDINNHKDRYFTIGENKRQKFAQTDQSLSQKMRHELIDVLYTYNNAFASDNEPLSAIKGHELDITLNIDRPYPPVLRRRAYPASLTAREALESIYKS